MKQLAFDFYAKKVCSFCGQEKLLDQFDKHPAGRDGFTCKCKKCKNAYRRQRRAQDPEYRKRRNEQYRQYHAANPEKARARSHKWDKANPEKRRAIARKWDKANPEKRRAFSLRWRQANPNKQRASAHKWKAANPDKVRAYTRLRRARKLEAPGNLTTEEEQRLYELYDHCLCCGTTEDLTLDHIVPLVEGGAHSIENCQILCRPCNSRKGTQTIDYR